MLDCWVFCMSVLPTKYIYTCISRGINMLLDEEKIFSVPKAFIVHQKLLWSLSNSFSHWHQNTYKNECLLRRIHPMLQVLKAPAVIIPLLTTVFPMAVVCWLLLVPFGRFSLGLCSLVPVWLYNSWGDCRQGTSFTDSLFQDFLDLFKTLSLPN